MPPERLNRVGFFNPIETVSTLTSCMSFGMINSVSVDQVEKSLILAIGQNYKVKIDFTEVLLEHLNPSHVGSGYIDSFGNSWTKKFSPLPVQKLRRFPDDTTISEIMAPYISILRKYSNYVCTIFLADEPYLNGISKSELERAGTIVRRLLDIANLKNVKLGVIFASGMFNAEFAQHLDRASGDYARQIDAYYERGIAVRNGARTDPHFDVNGFNDWISTISKSRLTTYDAAGNMYVGGGIPLGYDLVAFNFYLSTVLHDSVHENTLSWLASHSPYSCGKFYNKKMSSIRSTLSFIQDGEINQESLCQVSDRQILDDIYTCRMNGTLELLLESVQRTPAKIMMISESSTNGVLEFYSDGRPKEYQPNLLVESRVLDEVNRAIDFYKNHRSSFEYGLMFFIFNDARDHSINLDIYGAGSLPSVIDRIINFSME